MQEFSNLLAHERVALQQATEADVARQLGEFLFRYSQFVTALHYCVAWHDWGEKLDSYGDIANDLGTADLLNKIRVQVRVKYGQAPRVVTLYSKWLRKANSLRESRNLIMHSRWETELYGRYAIATSTPVFVDPPVTHHFKADDLRQLIDGIHPLISELNALRHKYYL